MPSSTPSPRRPTRRRANWAAASGPDSARLPRAVSGTVLDVSPNLLMVAKPPAGPHEQRFVLTGDATTGAAPS